MNKRPTRDQVPIESTWNLTDLFPSHDAFKKEQKDILQAAESLTVWKGKLTESGDRLFSALEAFFALKARLIRLTTYAELEESADSIAAQNQVDASEALAVQAAAEATLSFFEQELLDLDADALHLFIEQAPALGEYRPYLERLLTFKPHRLNPETEKTLKALSEVLNAPYTIYNRGKLADMAFAPAEDSSGDLQPVSFALYEGKYESSPDTVLRRNAYDSFTKTLDAYKHTFAAVYGTEVKKAVTLAKLRGYPSATAMFLHEQQVTETIYNNQLDRITAGLAPHMRRYAKLKQNALGLDAVTFADLKAPLDTYSPQTTYEESKAAILDALKIMGPDYHAIIEKGLSERWVDYADNIGKSTGGFCTSPYGAHSYILLTWTGDIRNILTLAHELGHAGHFALAEREQKLANYESSMFFVEAPSTLNELLLAQYLKKNATSETMRRSVTERLLSTYYHNFVTHLLEGVYQRRVFNLAEKGASITSTLLTRQKYETLADFWGDAVALEERDGLTWMRQPHYYMGLYSYTYSAGLTISTAVAKQIEEEGRPAAGRWLSVLKAGGSLPPLDLIQKAHVDLLNPDTIKSVIAYVGSLVDELEQPLQ